MSSVTRTPSVNTKALPDVQFVGGPYYSRETDPQKLLFPFTYRTGVLDIQVINDFDVNSTCPPEGILPVEEGGLARRMGGLHRVDAIGPTFKTYIQNVEWSTLDETQTPVLYKASNLQVYKAGLVTRVQQLSSQNLPADIDPDYSYVSSSKAPTDDFLLPIDGYGTTYVFEKPLVLSVDATLLDATPFGKQYITFYTSWDH